MYAVPAASTATPGFWPVPTLKCGVACAVAGTVPATSAAATATTFPARMRRILDRSGRAGRPRRALGTLVGVAAADQRRLCVEPAQVAIDHPRALTALVDRPHDERLAATRVAGGEDAVDAGLV